MKSDMTTSFLSKRYLCLNSLAYMDGAVFFSLRNNKVYK